MATISAMVSTSALRATAAPQIAVAAHVSAVATSVLLLVWTIHFRGRPFAKSEDAYLIINAHPVIIFMGFIFVSGEAIMAYNTIPATKKVKKMVHSLLQLVAVSMGVFGVYVAFKYHKENQITNLHSLHSWLGIITICLYGIQWLFGLFFFLYPGVPPPTRAVVAPWHVFVGLAIFLMAICTAQTGLSQNGVASWSESLIINFAGLFIFVFGFTVCLTALLPRLVTRSISTIV